MANVSGTGLLDLINLREVVQSRMSPTDIFEHPDNELIRLGPMSVEFMDSVEQYGVQEPITVLLSQGRWICLGGHRRRAAAILAGLRDVPVRQIYDPLTMAQQRILLAVLNQSGDMVDAPLRMEQAARMRMLELALLEERKNRGIDAPPTGLTRAVIAEQMGVSERTVQDALTAQKAIEEAKNASDNLRADNIAQVMEEKGFTAAARVARSSVQQGLATLPATNEHCEPVFSAPEHEPESEDEPESGPGPAAVAAFGAIKEFSSLIRATNGLLQDAKDLAQRPVGVTLEYNEIERLLRDVVTLLKAGKPYCECGKCRRELSKDCKACRGRGWVTKSMASKAFTKDDMEWVKGGLTDE